MFDTVFGDFVDRMELLGMGPWWRCAASPSAWQESSIMKAPAL